MVSLPIQIIDGARSLPEFRASAAREFFRRAAGHYSKMGTNTVAAIKALKIDLRRNATTVPILQEEIEYAFNQVIGVCNDCNAVLAYPKINRLVAIVGGRTFLGKTLSRQEEWVLLTTEWSNDVFLCLKLRATTQVGYVLFTPKHMKVESLVRHQLSISWASIHTTTQALTHIIYDLAERPEYRGPLREELERVVQECDGQFKQADLVKLRLMDSFMKESMRVNPATIVAPMRLTVEPLTVSTGQTIPAGMPFGFFSLAINNSKTLYNYPSPEVFDGFRFAKMREREGEENRHQFGATGPTETFDFGHGTHACPGRFFAATEIKLLFAYILQHYDLKLKEGEKRPQS